MKRSYFRASQGPAERRMIVLRYVGAWLLAAAILTLVLRINHQESGWDPAWVVGSLAVFAVLGARRYRV